MPKAPSEKTQIATLKRQLREEGERLSHARTERDHFRIRAISAEQQVNEWKSRFDKLLDRTPKEQQQ